MVSATAHVLQASYSSLSTNVSSSENNTDGSGSSPNPVKYFHTIIHVLTGTGARPTLACAGLRMDGVILLLLMVSSSLYVSHMLVTRVLVFRVVLL